MRGRLLRVDSILRDLPGRETRISVRSFVGQYSPILDFPHDVREVIERGDVNRARLNRLIISNSNIPGLSILSFTRVLYFPYTSAKNVDF